MSIITRIIGLSLIVAIFPVCLSEYFGGSGCDSHSPSNLNAVKPPVSTKSSVLISPQNSKPRRKKQALIVRFKRWNLDKCSSQQPDAGMEIHLSFHLSKTSQTTVRSVFAGRSTILCLAISIQIAPTLFLACRDWNPVLTERLELEFRMGQETRKLSAVSMVGRNTAWYHLFQN